MCIYIYPLPSTIGNVKRYPMHRHENPNMKISMPRKGYDATLQVALDLQHNVDPQLPAQFVGCYFWISFCSSPYKHCGMFFMLTSCLGQASKKESKQS